jgi:hypothetical protein
MLEEIEAELPTAQPAGLNRLRNVGSENKRS